MKKSALAKSRASRKRRATQTELLSPGLVPRAFRPEPTPVMATGHVLDPEFLSG